MPDADRPRAPGGRAVERYYFSSGDRPLDGYTIKRAIGRGGFGEVYYAVSDAGKEVALKLLLRNVEIEKRGVQQCMNLKSPHLITIFDMKTTDEGDTFVVMEYVAGPSLAQILDQHPDGLPPNEVRMWLKGLVDGVSYLHDHGIVHRDLKPANLFLEEGVGQDRRLRPLEVHRQQRRGRALGQRGHMPLHGAGDLDGQVSEADRHLRDRRHHLRDDHRPGAVRRGDAARGVDEAPDLAAGPLPLAGALPGNRHAGPWRRTRADAPRRPTSCSCRRTCPRAPDIRFIGEAKSTPTGHAPPAPTTAGPSRGAKAGEEEVLRIRR